MLKDISNRLLAVPAIYSFFQVVALPGQKRLLGPRLEAIFMGSKGVVLDVGCGPRLTTPAPEGVLVGIDINANYVRKYTGGYIDTDVHAIAVGKRSIYGFVGSADNLPFGDGVFDECRCAGVFHHFPTESASAVLFEMYRCLRRGGKIIVFDNVMPHHGLLRSLAWLIRKFDRGGWVRKEDQLVNLVHSAIKEEWKSSRFTYTYHGLEGMTFVAVKSR